MNKTSRIAYLIPVYNDQKGLNMTLYSINKAGHDADVLVIDDGSSPPMQMDPNLKVGNELIRLQNNSGVTKALNVGIEKLAEYGYEYVARLDAGDLTSPERIQAQADVLDLNQRCGAVACAVDHFRKGRVVFVNRPPCDSDVLKTVIWRRNPFDHPAVMLRLSALAEIGSYDPRFCGSEDYELWLRMTIHGWQLKALPEIYVNKEIADGQITGRAFRSWSRMKVQAHHFQPLNIHSWIGIGRTAVALCTSKRASLGWWRMWSRAPQT